MNHKNVLISVLLMPIVFTSCCQNSIDEKIEQLKEAWMQKAEELSWLGQKIGGKHGLMEKIAQKYSLSFIELYPNLGEVEKEAFEQEGYTSLENFNNEFIYAFNEKANVKDFIVKECIDKEEPFGFNWAKTASIRLILEHDLLKKIIKKYEDCMQELAEIDHELKVLLCKPY